MEHHMISSRAIWFLAAWMPECSKINKKNFFVMVKYFSNHVRPTHVSISEWIFFTVLKISGIWIGWEADWDTGKFHKRLISELSGITVGEQLQQICFGLLWGSGQVKYNLICPDIRLLQTGCCSCLGIMQILSRPIIGCKISNLLVRMAWQDFQLIYTQRTLSRRKKWSIYLYRSQINYKLHKVNKMKCLSAYVIFLQKVLNQNHVSGESCVWELREKSKA